MFAERMKYLESSGIRKMFELASKMKNPIDLSLGLPDFDVPENVKKTACDAIMTGKNRYTVTQGVELFQSAVQETLKKEAVPFESVMAVSGASGGLVLSLMALADSQTVVFVEDPCFVAYESIIRLAGATPVRVDTYPDFHLTQERLQKAVDSLGELSNKKRVLIFNSPSNPTGVAYTKDEIANLAQVTQANNIQVISDEVYDRFCYDFEHESWLKHDPRAVLIRTLGKTWGMTGWRSGYAAGPKDIIDKMITLQQFTYVCVNTPTQWASIEALKTDVSEVIQAYAKKRDFIYNELSSLFECQKPQGAFYIFPKIPGDADQFLAKCIENELLIVPGKAFGKKNTHFRVSFGLPLENLAKGVEVLRKVVKSI